MKYAFPDGRDGEILVRVDQADDGAYSLLVWDNGVGIPAGFGSRIQVTRDATGQDVERPAKWQPVRAATDGTRTELNFKESHYKKRI